MKQNVVILLLFFSSFGYSQKKEMVEAFRNGDLKKAIALAAKTISIDSTDIDANLMLLKAYNEKGDFPNALSFLKQCERLADKDWVKSWVAIESIKTYFGLGNIDEAKKAFFEANEIKGTENSLKELKYIGLLLGFDKTYEDWKIRTSDNIRFHFEGTISNEEMDRIVSTRQNAFQEINIFFDSRLPKKIDFFVWNQKDPYNEHLKTNLGFTKANFCVSHNRHDQSPGHEIAHSISFWKNFDNNRTKFINEGIGVYFDLQKNDKMHLGRQTFRRNPVDIKAVWKNQQRVADEVLYPISGAFVDFLIRYDKLKFLKLVEKQSYDSAERIYEGKIEELINLFYIELQK